MIHRVGVVGLGDIASKVYLPLLSLSPQVEIVGVASRSEARVEEVVRTFRLRAALCRNVDEVLGQRPDIVFVHTPPQAHYPVIVPIIRRGVPVYVDKPLSNDLTRAEELASLAARTATLLAVGFNRRFAPMVLAARDFVESPTYILAQKHRRVAQDQPSRDTAYGDLIHAVDLALWLSGGRSSDLSSGRIRSDPSGRLEVSSGSITASNVVSEFAMSRDTGIDFESLLLAGGNRSALVTNLEQVQLESWDQSSLKTFGAWDSINYRRGFVALIDHVFSSLSAPEACIVAAAATLEAHRTVERLLIDGA